MNRNQLINALSEKTGLDKKDVRRTIDEIKTDYSGSQRRAKNLPARFWLIQATFTNQPPGAESQKRNNRTTVSQDNHSF